MNQELLKHIQRVVPVYDPLIIYVNNNFLIEWRAGIGIKGSKFGDDIKVIYEHNGVPNMYCKYYEYCYIKPNIKHAIIEPQYKKK